MGCASQAACSSHRDALKSLLGRYPSLGPCHMRDASVAVRLLSLAQPCPPKMLELFNNRFPFLFFSESKDG